MSNFHASTFAHQQVNGVMELFQILAGSVGDQYSGNADAALLAACRAGNTLIVQGLLQLGSNVEARGEGGSTPLMICTELSLTDVARVLIAHGAGINAVNSNGETALILSVYSDATDVTKLLLEHPDIEKEHQNSDGYTALMCAIECLNWGAIFALFDAGACFGGDVLTPTTDSPPTSGPSVNTGALAEQIAKANGSLEVLQMLKRCTLDGIHPLERAVLNRDLKSTQLFVQHYVPSQTTPSICAMILKLLNCIQESVSVLTNIDVEIINILLDKLENADGDKVEKQKVLEVATAMDNYDLVQLLCQRGFVGSDGALGLAAAKGRCDILQLLLEVPADTSLLDSSSELAYTGSALQLAVVNEKFDCAKILISRGAKINILEGLTDALHRGSEEVLQFLIDQYPCVMKENFNSSNGFHVAVKRSDRRMINLMLDHGADVNLIIQGKTALMNAVDPIVVDLLLERGADVNQQVNSSLCGSALHHSLSSEYRSQVDDSTVEDVIRKLVENGANCNLQNMLGQSPLNLAAQRPMSSRIIRLLVHSGADVNERGFLGQTMLHIAAENDEIENVQALLDAGADINMTDDLGRCALFVSGTMGTICCLLGRGANVNSRDGEGNTVLMHVLNNEVGHLCDIGMLIDAGCDVNSRNQKSRTALMIAADSCNVEALKLLLEAGADASAVTEGPKKKTALKTCLRNLWEDNEEAATCCEILLEHKASVDDIDPSVVHQLIAKGHNALVEQFIHAGLGPADVRIERKIQGWFKGTAYLSPLCVALLTYNTGLARYFFRIHFLTMSDLTTLSKKQNVLKYLQSHSNLDCMRFLEDACQKPLSLETLCVIVVSSAIGLGRGREERVGRTGLPTPIQDALLFRRESVIGETTGSPGNGGSYMFTQYMHTQYMRMSLLCSLQKAERIRGIQSPSDSSEDENSD